jgi:hypothetical protein
VKGSLTSQALVRRLICESDHTVTYVVVLNKPYRRRFDVFHESCHQPLLHILHAGRFDSNNSRCLERFRNCDDPYRSLRSRFEEIHFGEVLLMVPSGRDEEITPREDSFESLSPFHLIELAVSLKSISGGPRSVPGDDAVVVDIFIYCLKHGSPQDRRRLAKLLQIGGGSLSIESANFLLTLDVTVDRLLSPSLSGWEKKLPVHQRKLTHGEYCIDVRLIEKSS